MPDEKPPVEGAAPHAGGFPSRTAMAHAVAGLGGWSVVAQHFPWRDEFAGDQFLDLVVSDERFVVCIEYGETQRGTLTFLQPLGGDNVVGARILYLEQIQDSTTRMELF